jgi:hypothetical protein
MMGKTFQAYYVRCLLYHKYHNTLGS